MRLWNFAAGPATIPLAVLEPEGMQWNGQLMGAMAWSVLGLTLGGSSLLYLLIQRGAATVRPRSSIVKPMVRRRERRSV